jgi:hypothetical protein
LQLPLASHVCVPLQLLPGPLVTAAHVPGLAAVLHAWHVPQLEVWQQTPSTQ